MDSGFLLARIAEAFPPIPAPYAAELLGETSYPAGESELQEIQEFFANRPWSDVTPADVFRFRLALPLFSWRALAYYSAAWMTCCLQDYDAVDTAPDDMIFNFERADPNLWTRNQRCVISLWADCMKLALPERARGDYERVAQKFRG